MENSDFEKICEFISNFAISKHQQNTRPTIQSLQKRFYSSICEQKFPFRNSLIFYITQNPSSLKLYQKMIKSCKHFFDKNPILVISTLYAEYGTTEWGIWFNEKSVELEKLVPSTKLWVIDEINVGNTIISPIYPFVNPNVCSDAKWLTTIIISKIYQSNIERFVLWNQTISFKDFVFVASNCKEIMLCNVSVVENESDAIVAVEKLIEVLPNLKDFEYNLPTSSNVITPNTLQELLSIPHFSNVIELRLNSLSEAFDLDKFFDAIKKNKKTTLRFSFSYEISDHYKLRLKAGLKEIIETKNHEFKIPMIDLPAMNNDDYALFDKLQELFDNQKEMNYCRCSEKQKQK
uniref:Uncharacterized protein n=1 Tax=Panagrolaimus sp. PS1159 TaxID=55785 RepID=A0AC35GLP1_9BILA